MRRVNDAACSYAARRDDHAGPSSTRRSKRSSADDANGCVPVMPYAGGCASIVEDGDVWSMQRDVRRAKTLDAGAANAKSSAGSTVA